MLSKGDTTGPLFCRIYPKRSYCGICCSGNGKRGILRSGLGFSQCDIGVLTNIEEDHLGMNDIHSLKDLTKVKRVVLDSVKKTGWSVLNADNEYSMKIVNDLDSNVAIFSMDENNPHIVKFAKEGRITCVYEEGFVTIKKGDWKIRIGKAKDFRSPWMESQIYD
jgi:cyanophycin synthetase